MAELLAANQITIAKVLDGEMSAEQLAQLNQASTDASQAKTDANNAQTSINNLEIGGRNLILNSETKKISKYKDTITTETGITVSEWGTKNAFRTYGTCSNSTTFGILTTGLSSPRSASGQAYVHSIYVKNNGGTAIYIANNGIGGSQIIQPGESKRAILYGTGNGVQYLLFDFSSSNLGDAFDVTYWRPKIEIGNKATDWTPAPEDVDAGIKDAAKVATNFIGYDSTNGLIIGNKTSGTWSGYHSQILSDRFNILDEFSTVLASFGTTTVIGEEAKANMRLTFNNLSMLNKENSVIFEVGDLRDASGVATLLFYSKVFTGIDGVVTIDLRVNIDSIISVVVTGVTISSSRYSVDGSCITITGLEKQVFKTFEITYTTLSSVPYLTFGTRNNSGKIGYFSSIEGDNLIASGFASHAEGSCSKSTADFSHSEGYNTQANGIYSHAEGNSTVAAGDASHAEGKETKTLYAYSHAEGQLSYARGQCSHAEGFNTIAYGYMAHSEGENTEAHGNESHAEGNHTYAGGKCSHAEGYYTIAGSDYQHVSGKYNEEDHNGLYAFIIGNGTSEEEPSNAFAVDWSGNVYMSLGDCTITDSGTALSVTSGASTLDGLVAQSIIDTFSYADAKEILEM